MRSPCVAAWNAASVVSVAILDGEIREDWPEGAVLAIRRTGGLKPITVGFALGGTATAGADYTADAGASVQIPAGAREAFARLTDAPAWGFDTESKPTFQVGEVSEGPHI